MTKHPVVVLCAAILLLLLGGCEISEEYWINPDGSGKVNVRIILDPGADPEQARRALCRFVMASEGVKSFSEVAFTNDKAGGILTATAYFDDITKLKLAGVHSGLLPTLVCERLPGGGFSLHGPAKPVAPRAEPNPMWGAPAPDVWARMLLRDAVRSMESGQVELTKAKRVVHVRDAKRVKVYAQDEGAAGESTLTLRVDGAEVMKKLKKLAGDGAAVEKLIGPAPSHEVCNFVLRNECLGEAATAEATFSATGAALFDYPLESAKGQKRSGALLIEKGIVPRDPPPGEKGAESWVPGPFFAASDGRGATLNFSIKAPGDVRSCGARSYYILTEAGEYLISDEHLSVEPSVGRLNLHIHLPRHITTGKITRIVGVCEVGIATGSREIDLGDVELGTGATGNKLGLTTDSWAVERVGPAFAAMFTLSLSKDAKEAKDVYSIRFRDGKSGAFFDVSVQPGKPWERVHGHHNFSEPPPNRFRATATVLEGYRVVTIPVDLRDVAVPVKDSPVDGGK